MAVSNYTVLFLIGMDARQVASECFMRLCMYDNDSRQSIPSISTSMIDIFLSHFPNVDMHGWMFFFFRLRIKSFDSFSMFVSIVYLRSMTAYTPIKRFSNCVLCPPIAVRIEAKLFGSQKFFSFLAKKFIRSYKCDKKNRECWFPVPHSRRQVCCLAIKVPFAPNSNWILQAFNFNSIRNTLMHIYLYLSTLRIYFANIAVSHLSFSDVSISSHSCFLGRR